MSDPLVEEGWLAPVQRGPSRLHAGLLLAMAILFAFAWFGSTMVWKSGPGDGAGTYGLEVNSFGRAIRTDSQKDLPTEVRSARRTDYLVVRDELADSSGFQGSTYVTVVPPPGVDAERIIVRIAGTLDRVSRATDPEGRPAYLVKFGGPRDEVDILVAIPVASLDLPADKAEPVGALDAVTGPIDERRREDAEQVRTLEQLRDMTPWLLPLLVFASVGVPLLLWRRAARRFFSMRRPGPGTDTEGVPPSSLDPVGAAVLVAGADPVDAGAAFAGHVVDLVERRQLLARRTLDADPGAGVLIGLGHVDEQDDDPAVAALRSIAVHDGLSAPLPDARAKRRQAAEDARDAWHLHVAARARFEAMVDRVDVRRIAAPALALAVVGLVAFALGVASDGSGRRAEYWLVAAAVVPAAVALALWARDAARWRIVTRARRTERAQWIAWRAALGASGAAALDPRSLAVLAATGTDLPGVRASATPEAVGLDAVTATTIEALRSVVADVAP